MGSRGADAVHAADALHEAGGIPWRVVVYDDVGAVQIDAFREHFGGNDDVEIMGLLLERMIGVEVGADRGHKGGAV